MMTALGNLGEYDARFSGSSGENWLELLPDFIGSVHVFAAAVGDESVHSVIGRCASLLVECRKLLQGHWNTDLPNSPMMTALLQNIVAPAGEEYKSMNIDAVAARTEKGNEPKGKFVDVTPPPEKLMDEEKIHCQEQSCAALFSSHAAARLHYKKYHPIGLYVSPLKVVDPTTGKKGVVKTRIDKVNI